MRDAAREHGNRQAILQLRATYRFLGLEKVFMKGSNIPVEDPVHDGPVGWAHLGAQPRQPIFVRHVQQQNCQHFVGVFVGERPADEAPKEWATNMRCPQRSLTLRPCSSSTRSSSVRVCGCSNVLLPIPARSYMQMRPGPS